ncbi:titin [Caerostris darwini]|uniref:Titin n=1 Tax=Caerostris darwini TaxID=1538125 RepID=A0AAV4R618_9ARAC|nr:titin [Caerostris darwini]
MRETVQCNVLHGDAPFEFSWFKDGELLKDGQGISIRKTDDYDSKLVILKVDANSNGNYTCRVANSKGFDEKSAILLVKGTGEQPKLKPLLFSNDLELGMRESVHCNVYGEPPFEFLWFKDGQPVKDIRGISVRKTDEYTSNMVILQVDADSNGNYTCRVSNTKGFDEKSAALAVKESGEPKVKSFHFSNVLELGMRESVQCSVMYGNPPFEFTWYKDNRKIIENQVFTTGKFDEFTSRLVISKVNADSNGNYTCRVSNSAGFDEQSAVLSVKVKQLLLENGVASVCCSIVSVYYGVCFCREGYSENKSFPLFWRIGCRNESICTMCCHLWRTPFQFLWTKDNQKISEIHDVSLRNIDDFTSNLVISKVNADSNGNYTCRATNSKGFDEKSALLSVKEFGIPKISPFHFPGELDIGMRTSIVCAVIYGDPPFDFSWSKDGQILAEKRSVSTKNIDDFTSNLVISKVDADSNGNYTCRATNSKGFDEKSAVLSVNDLRAPKINPFHFSGELDVGMRASAHCDVIYGDIPFEFTWLKDGYPLVEIQGISFRKTDEYTSNLVISKVNADSNGNYTCRVTNAKGSDEKSAVLSVKDSGEPKIKAFHFSNALELGMRESVQCTVISGDPPFEFSWFKDGRPLIDLRDISVHKTDNFMSTLVISKVNADSNGNYTCRVANSAGFHEKSAVLSVQGMLSVVWKVFIH